MVELGPSGDPRLLTVRALTVHGPWVGTGVRGLATGTCNRDFPKMNANAWTPTVCICFQLRRLSCSCPSPGVTQALCPHLPWPWPSPDATPTARPHSEDGGVSCESEM